MIAVTILFSLSQVIVRVLLLPWFSIADHCTSKTSHASPLTLYPYMHSFCFASLSFLCVSLGFPHSSSSLPLSAFFSHLLASTACFFSSCRFHQVRDRHLKSGCSINTQSASICHTGFLFTTCCKRWPFSPARQTHPSATSIRTTITSTQKARTQAI